MNTFRIAIGTLLVTGIVAMLVVLQATQVDGSAFSGSNAKQAFATTTVVGPTGFGTTIFPAKPSCTARTISTTDGTGMGIKFLTADSSNGDLASTTLTQTVGLWQAGSTTVTYDGGLNGCGRWTARALASTTLTVVEYQ